MSNTVFVKNNQKCVLFFGVIMLMMGLNEVAADDMEKLKKSDAFKDAVKNKVLEVVEGEISDSEKAEPVKYTAAMIKDLFDMAKLRNIIADETSSKAVVKAAEKQIKEIEATKAEEPKEDPDAEDLEDGEAE